MRMSDQEYFRSCIAKERQLAQLLGHTHIEECYESAGTLWDNDQPLPRWTRDWAACGPLLAQHGLTISYSSDPSANGGRYVRIGATMVHLSDHPNADRALMYGIVKEVIHKLEHARHHRVA